MSPDARDSSELMSEMADAMLRCGDGCTREQLALRFTSEDIDRLSAGAREIANRRAVRHMDRLYEGAGNNIEAASTSINETAQPAPCIAELLGKRPIVSGEIEAKRRSWVIGELMLDDPDLTTEAANHLYDEASQRMQPQVFGHRQNSKIWPHVVGIDARALAVEIVDGVRGHTLEFSGDPSAHAADYDLAEERIRTALSAKPEVRNNA